MYLPDFELHEAQSPAEAAALLAEHARDALLMAGGTDLLVDLKTGRRTAGHVVWLNRIEALRGIASDADGIRIGALTTISQLLDSAVVRDRCRPLLDAASQMAAPQIRNLATIGGNIACAAPCADIPPILMVMSASAELVSGTGTRQVLLDELFVGPRQTVIGRDEVLTAVHVPEAPIRSGAAYARFALREGNAIAVAASAVRLVLGDTDCIAAARIALGCDIQWDEDPRLGTLGRRLGRYDVRSAGFKRWREGENPKASLTLCMTYFSSFRPALDQL